MDKETDNKLKELTKTRNLIQLEIDTILNKEIFQKVVFGK